MTGRSLLYSPGDEREMLEKAVASSADTVIFDLEDAVAPGARETARRTVREVVDELDDPEPSISVRINPYDREGPADLEVLVGAGERRPDSIVLPKVERAPLVEDVTADLAAAGAASVDVIPLIETAAGLLAVEDVAAASGVVAIAYGDQDYTADVGATVTAEKTESLYARQRTVAAAAAAGVDVIDTVYTDIEDTAGLREQTRRALEFGFDGKLAVHPAQVPVINEAFTPSDEEIEWAERVLGGHEQASETDAGVFTVDGQMIDAPLVERARAIVRRAEAAGVR
jgi:citrate lyase subunit beta/citryl-CoA lyase